MQHPTYKFNLVYLITSITVKGDYITSNNNKILYISCLGIIFKTFTYLLTSMHDTQMKASQYMYTLCIDCIFRND